MSEQETAVVEREFVVGTPETYFQSLLEQFDELVKNNPRFRKARDGGGYYDLPYYRPETDYRRAYEGRFEPANNPVGPGGHIEIRPTSPRLDPMTGGPLPSREAELDWLGGFQSATCMPSRSRYRRRGIRIGSPYVDFRIL